MRVIAVIPAYQAESAIGRVVALLKPQVSEVVVVDDGSSDGTAGAARAAGASVVRHLVNRGYGAALTTGGMWALAAGADVIVHFDADGQLEAADVPRLVVALAPARPSVALGSRFLGRTVGLPFWRRLTLKLGIVFTWAFSGLWLTDAHNGLRAFTASALRQMVFRQDRMAYASEVVDEIARLKLPYREVPVTVHYTPESRRGSQQGSLPGLRIVRDLFLGKFMR